MECGANLPPSVSMGIFTYAMHPKDCRWAGIHASLQMVWCLDVKLWEQSPLGIEWWMQLHTTTLLVSHYNTLTCSMTVRLACSTTPLDCEE